MKDRWQNCLKESDREAFLKCKLNARNVRFWDTDGSKIQSPRKMPVHGTRGSTGSQALIFPIRPFVFRKFRKASKSGSVSLSKGHTVKNRDSKSWLDENWTCWATCRRRKGLEVRGADTFESPS